MRTNIVIDDKLVRAAMRATGLKTKRAVIHASLELLVAVHGQIAIRKVRGGAMWTADRTEARDDRSDTGPRRRAKRTSGEPVESGE